MCTLLCFRTIEKGPGLDQGCEGVLAAGSEEAACDQGGPGQFVGWCCCLSRGVEEDVGEQGDCWQAPSQIELMGKKSLFH